MAHTLRVQRSVNVSQSFEDLSDEFECNGSVMKLEQDEIRTRDKKAIDRAIVLFCCMANRGALLQKDK